MGKKIIQKRKDINKKYIWNLEAMYSSDELWEKDIEKAQTLTEKFIKHKGHLMESSGSLLSAIKAMEEINQIIEKAFVYARMKMDEDNLDSKRQGMLDKITTIISDVNSKMSFFTPEMLGSDEEKIHAYVDTNLGLKPYHHMLENILRRKKHVLSEEEENILSSLGQITSAPHAIFSMLNNGDLKFGEIKDENDKVVEITHGNYINFMESHNRRVRKDAFESMYKTYKSMINTLSTTYGFSVKSDVVKSKLRKFDSTRQNALSSGNIPELVYDNLVKVVTDNLTNLHRYMNLRKRMLGLDKLQMWDVYVPLVKLPEKDIPFESGVEIMLEALKPLGEDYCNNLQTGIDNRWIDVYETPGKTSGAYSFGSYDSMPYSLLNYTDTLKDVFTLVHEMGHSMHSYYTRKTQPYTYGDHSIFTAEVASTVNESLLIKHLLDKETDLNVKKFLINFYLEEFRGTLFRQTMFAEFEHMAHSFVEAGGSLTTDWLNKTYKKLNAKYYGNDIAEDEFIQYEWSRIPHFYRAYYVYQYATGFSAATAISERILKGDKKERDEYLKFLSLGSSKDPMDLLKIAGVDMGSPEPIKMAMYKFNTLLDELERIENEEQ
ncbi:oligoendopeptidase F [Eubacteriales bacterium KG127]